MELRLAATRGNAKHVGDFFVPVAFDIVKGKDSPGAWGEASDGRLEVDGDPRCGRGSREVPRAVVILIVRGVASSKACTVAASGFAGVEDDVDAQAEQPGAKGALAAKRSESLPTTDKHILRQLLREDPVAGHAGAQGEHAVHMRTIQPLKGAAVPGRGKRHIRKLSGPIGVGWGRHRSNWFRFGLRWGHRHRSVGP